MFKKFSARLVSEAEKHDIIESDSVEENIYGVNAFLTILLHLITAFVIGMIFNMLIEMILFIVIYKSLGKYCGGSHADTAWKCYIVSFVIYIAVMIAVRYYPPSAPTMIIMICCGVLLFILSPAEAINKPLDDIERKVYAFRSRVSILAIMCIFFALYYIPNEYLKELSITVAVSVVTVTISVIVGKLQLHIYKKRTAGLS